MCALLPRSGVVWSIGLALALASSISCGSSGSSNSPTPTVSRPVNEALAIDVALIGSHAEGVLLGDPQSTLAELLPYAAAQTQLETWGAVFPDMPNLPGDDDPMWLVTLVGYGDRPGPAQIEPESSEHECLEIKVLVPDGAREELALFGNESDACAD